MDTLTPQDLAWTTGNRLAKARTAAKVSSEGMASHLGVTRTTVSNYEHDRTRPTRAVLVVWSQVTGAPFEWLAGADQEVTQRSAADEVLDGRELVAA